jgi:hypothetical protein
MATTIAREEAEAALRSRSTPVHVLAKTLKKMGAGVDAALQAQAARRIVLEHHWTFASSCKRLSPAAIRLFLREPRPRLVAKRRPPATQEELASYDAALVLLWEAVPPSLPDAAMPKAWRTTLEAMLDLDTTYPWQSAKRRDKIERLATDAHLLAGARAAASACAKVPLNILAALARDGDAASLDALLPHLHRAETVGDETLDRLAQIIKAGNSHPAAKLLLARVPSLLAERRAKSPALELARVIGVAAAEPFWFSAFGDSVQRTSSVTRARFIVAVDSRDARWLNVYVSELYKGSTDFDDAAVDVDELGLGRCSAVETPRWLATVAKKLRLLWDWPSVHIRSSVRGAAREQIRVWLAGGAKGK